MYIADLHIHSRYSRATSRELALEQLDLFARRKGIRLLGTGDFTHPAWRKELWEKLEPAEDGFYRLKREFVRNPEEGGEEDRPRFVVTGEISSIYKQDGRVRKVHSLIVLPGLEAAGRLAAEGIRRLRAGEVTRLPGFDGEYGVIRLFEPGEIENMDGQLSMGGLWNIGSFKTEKARGSGKQDRTERGEADAAEGERREAPKAVGPDFLSRLNREQRLAAETPARSMAVIAGPGTGKTGTLSARIRVLMEVRRVKPSEITAVTFTGQAAGELKERLQREMPGSRLVSRIQTGTFHAICYALLKTAGREIVLADDREMEEIARAVLEERNLQLSPVGLLKLVSGEKNRRAVGPDRIPGQNLEQEESHTGEQEAVSAFIRRMKERGLWDFDDLLAETLGLFTDPEAARTYGGRFRYLLVAEFQDISPLQYRLIAAWNRAGKELFVIGDPDQSVYGFRGAAPDCFSRLLEDFPDTEMVRLRENYRSTARIKKAACALVSHNPGEARRQISMAGAGETAVRSFGDIAVLCRTNRQTEEMEEYLRTEGIPYTVSGRGTFLEEETVREAVDFFKELYREAARTTDAAGTGQKTGPDRKEGIRQEPEQKTRSGTGKSSGPEYGELLEKYMPLRKKKPAELLKRWMEDRDLTSDGPLQRLSSMAVFYKTMEIFLYQLEFGEEGDLKRCGGKRYTADSVSLMTLHGSKGLEFPAVIIPGVNKYSIPLEFPEKKVSLEEERRLFYVGMTWAKEELVLVTGREPSAFLSELPESTVIRVRAEGKQKPEMRQLSLFEWM